MRANLVCSPPSIERHHYLYMKKTILLGLALAVQLATSTQVLRGQDTALVHHHVHTNAAHHALKSSEEPAEEEATDADDSDAGYGEEESKEGSDDTESGDSGYGDAEEVMEEKEKEDGAATGAAFDEKFAGKGEKHWVVPNMKPNGFFKGEAGLTPDGRNKTILENTFKPTMIPTDGFAIRASEPLEKNVTTTDLATGVVPKTVQHGELKKMRASEDIAEDEEVEGELKMKEDALVQSQSAGACGLMENALQMARAARSEEEAAKVEGSQALVDVVKMICPALKYQYSFIMRCKQCEKMISRIESFYAPAFDTKVFPGLAHPDKCDKEKWPMKNYGVLLFFGRRRSE